MKLPNDLPKWMTIVSKITYFVLYVFMFTMPISGILMSYFGGYSTNVYNLFTIPAPSEPNNNLSRLFKEIHENVAILLCITVGLHICAALYHHFIRKDNILKNMLGIQK